MRVIVSSHSILKNHHIFANKQELPFEGIDFIINNTAVRYYCDVNYKTGINYLKEFINLFPHMRAIVCVQKSAKVIKYVHNNVMSILSKEVILIDSLEDFCNNLGSLNISGIGVDTTIYPFNEYINKHGRVMHIYLAYIKEAKTMEYNEKNKLMLMKKHFIEPLVHSRYVDKVFDLVKNKHNDFPRQYFITKLNYTIFEILINRS